MCVKHHPQYQIPDIVDYVRIIIFIRIINSVGGFPCGSPLQHKSDFWPKSQPPNFFTKAYFKC